MEENSSVYSELLNLLFHVTEVEKTVSECPVYFLCYSLFDSSLSYCSLLVIIFMLKSCILFSHTLKGSHSVSLISAVFSSLYAFSLLTLFENGGFMRWAHHQLLQRHNCFSSFSTLFLS